ncbi:MAG: CHASE2 domain-containing protein [Treponemataceae bacterium]
MSKTTRSRRRVFIPIAVGGLFAIVSLFLPGWNLLEYSIYDTFLMMKPDVKEDPSIVLLDVNDLSIQKAGSWPWPRGLMAGGLATMTEFGVNYAIFDIEFLEKSPMSVDRDYLSNGLKAEFDGVFDEVGSNVGSLFGAIAGGNIPVKAAGEYGEQLMQLIAGGKKDLYAKTERVAVENDSDLGRSMRLFGNAFVTLNMQDERVDTTNPELRTLAETKFSYPRITVRSPLEWLSKDFFIPIDEVSSMAKNAGFTNVKIDSDGVRRRIRLVEKVGDKYYLQLAFSPLVHALGEPEIEISRSRIVLKGAKLKGKTTDISIPLDEAGHMLLRWEKKTYPDSFAHMSFYQLIEYRKNEENLISNLRSLKGIEAWALVEGSNPVDEPLTAWRRAEELKQKALASGAAEDRAAWLEAKTAFKKTVDHFLQTGWDVKMTALLDAAKGKSSVADWPLYDAFKDRFAAIYGNCAKASDILESTGKELRARLAGSTCIIGWTASGSTDMGANPFDEKYVNVGTHATVINGIRQQDFLSDAPSWIGSAAAIILSFLIIFFIAQLKTVYQIVIGLGATLMVFLGSYLIFHFTGIHVPTLAPTLATFFSFMTYALVSFLVSEREKSFLRKAFGTYLSGDVINEIIANPSMLKLGGQKKWMTAMFTDIRGFSTVSEKLDPEQLVKLLNLYLSGMSDIILENRGTIDKYEGDAIISFYGAPLSYDLHARAACLAAVIMKKKEAELNVKFMADNITPNPLLTRIGLNTGDMVVGNMGTERKMDYTIMGNAVNLAARLEGVNKQYGSWILASDATKKEAGEEFISRRFDKVRVVGINTPVQLWEIVGLKSDADDKLLDFLDRFEKAHRLFDSMDWKRAEERFGALAAERPDDGPSGVYLKRSQGFLEKPPVAGWDGVFSLTEK